MKSFLNKLFSPHSEGSELPTQSQLQIDIPLSTENLYDNQKRALIGWIANRMGQMLHLDRSQYGSFIYHSFTLHDQGPDSIDDGQYLLSIASSLVTWILQEEDVYLKIKELKLYDHYHKCLLETYEENKDEIYRFLGLNIKKEIPAYSQEDEIWNVYRDVIYAATQRKFLLIKKSEVAAYREGQVLCEMPIVERTDIPVARDLAKEKLIEYGIVSTDIMGYLLVISEAITNILKHASEGSMAIIDAGTSIHVLVADKGPGFPLKILPNTVLMAGYSTKKSLGQGFTLMLKMTEKVYLSTVPNEGSTLILAFKSVGKGVAQHAREYSAG